MGYTRKLPDEDEAPEWPVPWHARILPIALIAAFAIAWVMYFPIGMSGWGISATALGSGRFDTIFLHMFAHAGAGHLVMNSVALWASGGALIGQMGNPPMSWLRFLALLFVSGLVGAAVFLALHPTGAVPMVGASGAISGLLGLLVRLRPHEPTLHPVRSRHIRTVAIQFGKDNLLLIVLLTLPALLFGAGGGVAWEAHLGGFVFGLLIGPYFLGRKIVIAPDVIPEPADDG